MIRIARSTAARAAAAVLILFATVATIAPASAATFCVGTVAELRAALQSAQAPGDDEIRIRAGTYLVDATLVHATASPGWLVVSGGYIDGGGSGCGARRLDAEATVLDGQGVRQVMILSYQPGDASTTGARFVVENLALRNGVGSGLQRGGGLDIGLFGSNVVNEIWLDNLVVRNSSGYFAGGVNAYVSNGHIRVVNSLFDANSAPTSASAHLALIAVASPPAYGRAIVVANSTFARGSCAGSGGSGYVRGCGIGINLGAGLAAEIANSVFHQNQIADLTAEAGQGATGTERVVVRDSLLPVDNGTVARTLTRPVAGDPGFTDAAAGDFLPREDSPLVDRGVLPLPGVYPQYLGFDVDGRQRVQFAAIDVGARERQTLDRVFRDGFEP